MRIVLSILFLVIAMQGFAQTLPIDIDFKTKTLSNLPKGKKLRAYQWASINVKDLPAGQYKISINKTDSTLSAGNEPALFGILKFGDGFNSILGGLSAYAVRSVPGKAGQSVPVIGIESLTEKSMQQTVDPCMNYDNVKKIQDAMRASLFDLHFAFRDGVIKPADLLYTLMELKPGTVADTAILRSEAQKIISNRLDIEKKVETLYKSYYDQILNKDLYKGVEQCSYLRVADSMLVNYKKGFNSFLTGFDTVFNEIRMVKEYNRLKAPKTSSFTSLPVSIKSDITTIAIDISGIDATKTPQNYSTVIELERRPYHLWAFTTGVHIAGIKSKELAIVPTIGASNDTTYSIVQHDGSSVEAGINALMHIGGYFKNSDIGWFGSFGPGLSLENKPRPRVLIGTGLMFGRTNKVALSFGFIGGPEKQLAQAYESDISYKVPPSKDDLVTDRFRGSWYISLGYAIFGK